MSLLSRYYDELSVGERMVTRGRTVTETDVVMWCSLTGDMFRLHTDRHYAQTTMFGQRIAPGLLINALMAGLGVPPDSDSILANYGTDELRFTAPTFLGDTVHLEAEVLEKRERRAGRDGIVTLQWNAVNQNRRTVMTSRLMCLMAMRP
ncbi:MAG TPA: MaoC/PaaZ C-terminal domain-containing protein, partial [Alphaproteobacteria bacterium]|nr:MaoC/PaaZ C-terminal domain-containing protein [Alphaproteobacteria bacterium]